MISGEAGSSCSVGPSGCGKTTLLRIIAGLEEPTEALSSSERRTHAHPKDRDVAMVFQNYALYPHMTVFENLAFGLECERPPKVYEKSNWRRRRLISNLLNESPPRSQEVRGRGWPWAVRW